MKEGNENYLTGYPMPISYYCSKKIINQMENYLFFEFILSKIQNMNNKQEAHKNLIIILELQNTFKEW